MTIFTLLVATFAAQPIEELLAKARENGIEQSEIDDILMYTSAFLSNMGNYKSFGDTKFIPQTCNDRFRTFLLSSKLDAGIINKLFDSAQTRMYSLLPRHRQVPSNLLYLIYVYTALYCCRFHNVYSLHYVFMCTIPQLGLGAEQGISTYFSANCEQADADLAGRFMNSINMSPYNTRLFKHPPVAGSASSASRYVVLLASAVTGPVPQEHFPFQSEYVFEGATFEIRLGDHTYAMRQTVESLRQAAG